MAAGFLAACGASQAAPETTMAPGLSESPASGSLLHFVRNAPLAAREPLDAAALTLTRSAHEGLEGPDPQFSVQLEAGPSWLVALSAPNHSPYDVAAQALGGALSIGIGSGTAALVLFRVAEKTGAPQAYGPTGPASMAVHEGVARALVLVGLAIAAFEETETDTGIIIAPPTSDAVCGGLVHPRG
ncbi:MAG: hypothetical protein KGS44_02250 [Alphaproteobacteria bacterium]|nr:hypothetical protein [Alphaproteobacteria bacterium]